MISLVVYFAVAVPLIAALGIVTVQRDRARYALSDHLAECRAAALRAATSHQEKTWA